jgi:hypothetical protein
MKQIRPMNVKIERRIRSILNSLDLPSIFENANPICNYLIWEDSILYISYPTLPVV